MDRHTAQCLTLEPGYQILSQVVYQMLHMVVIYCTSWNFKDSIHVFRTQVASANLLKEANANALVDQVGQWEVTKKQGLEEAFVDHFLFTQSPV